eukprot:XP_011669817.1 PREDICTED: methyltransferase-like protein 13 [Strongylocentrotus purpuratus]
MDLLPKTSSDIDSAQYWESLLKKHRNQAFECYNAAQADKTLVVGCGNSRLSEDLYDVGYHQLVNIDDVDSVVKQKTMKNAKQRPKMKFERMDVTQMTYEDSSFTVVLDRGNLDARMTDQGQETVASVEKTFGEIGRVLKVGGRYVCITLAQEHLIRKLLGHFSSEGWMVRIHKIDTPNQDEGSESSSPMPIFIVVSTKFKKMAATQSPILELSLSEGRSPERVSSIEDVMKAIKSQQDYAMLQHSLHKRSFCDESLSLDLYAPSNENPRFTLYIVDKPKGRVPANKFAIFIVPQGRETEYLFGTDRGRGQLADQAGFQRLVVVTLHRGHLYQSIDSIKTELSSKVMELKPSELPSNTQGSFGDESSVFRPHATSNENPRLHSLHCGFKNLKGRVPANKFAHFICTNNGTILELSLSEGRSLERVSSIEDVVKAIKSQQDYAMLQHSLHKRSFCDESLSLDLYAPGNENPRFTLYIVDKPKGRVPANKFAIFIVPQGRETEYLFGTDRGRGQLADQAGFQRLVVVTLHRGHLYQSIDSIKTELSSKVMELKPSELPSNTQVPFLSIGEDVGDREVRYEAEGSHSNRVIVEDVRGEDGGMYRQIIFSSNPNIVQSQAKLVTEKPRSKSGKKRGKAVTRVDHLYLSMTFHRIMTAGLALIPGCLDLLRTRARGLLIGLGGGGLPMFLYKQFPKLELDVVELDPMLKDVAKSWFGLVEDERLRIHIQDGLDFIKSAAEKDPPSLYNVVLFDVDSKDSTKGLSCPPKAFVEPVVLERVKRILHPTQGIFILNFACRDDVLKESVISEIQTHFPSVYTSPMEDDINEIVHCLPQRTSDGTDKMKVQYRDGARALQKYAKSVSSRWESDFDLCEIMDDLQIKDER